MFARFFRCIFSGNSATTHLQPVFSYLGLRAGDMPVSEQAAQEVLALPMFQELTEAEIGYVVESIAEFYS
jgi:dTDP-4-amino-4,6-dideoxygalactose transaminase